jgi:hypothetical protein
MGQRTRQDYLQSPGNQLLIQDWNWQEIKELELNESVNATQFAVYSAFLDSYKCVKPFTVVFYYCIFTRFQLFFPGIKPCSESLV